MRFWHYQPRATVNNLVPDGMEISCTVQSNQAKGGCTAEGTCTGSCDPASKESGLMYSRDGGASFAYVGNDRAASVLGVGLWGSGASATTWAVPTPIELNDRLLVYFSGTDVNENMRVDPLNSAPQTFAGVAIARPGGLASLDAVGYGDAAFALTHPLVFAASASSGELHLLVNFDTRGIGALAVELQDPSTGAAFPGFDLASARSFAGGNALRGAATWKEHGSDVSVLAGKPIVIRFVFTAPCKLFSFEVVEAEGDSNLRRGLKHDDAGGSTCSVQLAQRCSESACVANQDYGCYNENNSMWVDHGCRGMFSCNGIANVRCDPCDPVDCDPPRNLTVCSCVATPPPTPGPATKYMLLDDRNVVPSRTNASFVLGTVTKHGRPLIKEDRSYEMRFDK